MNVDNWRSTAEQLTASFLNLIISLPTILCHSRNSIDPGNADVLLIQKSQVLHQRLRTKTADWLPSDCRQNPNRGETSMGILQIAFIVGLAGQSASGGAQTTPAVSVPIERQLSGVTPREATDLIAKLEDAQRLLKAGKFQSFELLAGSIASYDKTKVSPREAFLQVPFRSVWNVERVRSDNKLAQPYRLAYAPDGLGKPYWDIEVVLDINNDIDRVSMTYRPPAPF